MSILSFEFKAQPKPENEGLPKEISGIAYTGAMIKNHGSLGDVIVDLDSIKIPSKLLLLNDHDHKARIGLGRVRKKGNSLLLSASLVLDESTLTLRRQLAHGLPIGLSIGVAGEVEKPAKAVVVNGAMVKPDTVIRNAQLREVSVVSFGADSEAMITAAFNRANRERELSALLFQQVANSYVISL